MNNNGIPNGLGNNSFDGNMMDPVANKASESLMGGQGSAPSVPDMMQGFSGVQNESNAMQGVGEVSNEPTMMQGMQSPEPEFNNVVPGQGHSGINSYTMEYQTPEPNPTVDNNENTNISINQPTMNVPENPVNVDTGVDYVETPNVEPQKPNPFLDKFINDNNVNNNMNTEVNNMDVTPGVPNPNLTFTPNMSMRMPVEPQMNNNPLPNMNNNMSVDVEPVSTPDIPTVDISTTANEPINPATIDVMPAPTVTYDNINENQLNNEQAAPDLNVNVTPAMPNNNAPMNNFEVNPSIDNTIELNNNNMGVAPVTVNVPNQIGAETVSESDDLTLDSKKKFPLTLRETILVTIALIGIIIVIIMYWPN